MAWIGFDFDGTLAREYGLEPILPMVRLLRKTLKNGTECRIFTARASHPEGIKIVKGWLKENNLPDLQVTNIKDYQMVILYDDRARQVVTNVGTIVGEEDEFKRGIIIPEKKIVVRDET